MHPAKTHVVFARTCCPQKRTRSDANIVEHGRMQICARTCNEDGPVRRLQLHIAMDATLLVSVLEWRDHEIRWRCELQSLNYGATAATI